MSRKTVVKRLVKLGEQTVTQAAEALSKNRGLQDKLETVVKSGLAVKDEVEGNVKVVIDRLNLKSSVDVDAIKGRIDALESDIESLLGELSNRVSDLTGRVSDLRARIIGKPANDEPIATPTVATPKVAEEPLGLEFLTVKSLRALAAERGIEVPSRILKADLLALIKAD